MPPYFAYGSNLDLDDLNAWAQRQGCGAVRVRFRSRAWLPDHALRFHYHSPARGGGALDVVPHRGCAVEGASFEVDSFDLLDVKEGVGAGRYERRSCLVVREDGAIAEATTYRVTHAHRRAEHVPPTVAYVNTVRRGMRRWGIDEAAVERAAAGVPTKSWPRHVFVYGTLKRGYCRAHVMERAHPQRVAPATVRGRLVDLGDYPGLVAGDGVVHGELWSYDEVGELLGELDAIEDFEGWDSLDASLYARTVLLVEVGSATERAWTYLWRGSGGATVEGGRWTGA